MERTISVKLTLEQLESLLALADNQLFRMKFIDTKMPGYTSRPHNLQVATSAVQVLQEAFKSAKGFGAKTKTA